MLALATPNAAAAAFSDNRDGLIGRDVTGLRQVADDLESKDLVRHTGFGQHRQSRCC
jgi:hypothetical protein